MPQPGDLAEKIGITFWFADYPFPTYSGGQFLDPMRKRAEEFGRIHPEYHIDIQGLPFPAMAREVARAVERGQPPDVAGYYASASQLARDTLGKDGRPLFTSVEKAIGGRTEILGEPVVVDHLVPAVREYYSRDGELWSLPTSATTTVLYSNRSLLDAAGVTTTPRTWDEVEAACRAVARLDNGPARGITWPNHGWLFQQAIAQQGGLLANHDNGRGGRAETVNLASKEMLAWVNWWLRLYEDGHYLYTGTQEDWVGNFEAFVTQRVAFILDSSKAAEEFVQAGREAGFSTEVSRMPYNDQFSYGGCVISGDSLWLADGLDKAKEDGALAFMQYLINPGNAVAWHQESGFIPITEKSHELLDREGWFDERAHRRVASDQIRASNGSAAALGALIGDFAGIHDVLMRAIDDVLGNGADPFTRFTRATDEAQEVLAAYNADCLGPVPRTPRRLAIG